MLLLRRVGAVLTPSRVAFAWGVEFVSVYQRSGPWVVELPGGRIVAESDSADSALLHAFWTSPEMDYGTEPNEPPEKWEPRRK